MAIAYTSMAQQLIEVASFGKNQPIGVAVAPKSNRLFVSFPRTQPYLYGLTEIVNGQRVPFPDADWNKVDTAQSKTYFMSVQDLYADYRITYGYLTLTRQVGPRLLVMERRRRVSLNS